MSVIAPVTFRHVDGADDYSDYKKTDKSVDQIFVSSIPQARVENEQVTGSEFLYAHCAPALVTVRESSEVRVKVHPVPNKAGGE